MPKSYYFPNNGRFVLRVVILAALVALALGAVAQISQAAPAEQSQRAEERTPFQESLIETVNARKAAGQPAPTVIATEYEVEEDFGIVPRGQGRGPRKVTINATTTVEYSGPQEAGLEEWPPLIVEDNLPPEAQGAVLAGDYTEVYHEYLAEQVPGIWDMYTFGQEPRRRTITEVFVITYPDGEASAPLEQIASKIQKIDASSASTSESFAPLLEPGPVSEDILMGFTYTGPEIDKTVGDKFEVCVIGCFTVYDFTAGLTLDWSLGLRLPAEVTVTGPDPVELGSNFNLEATLDPLNWSASDYSSSGVAAEGGNEFVLRVDFFAGVEAVIAEVDLCPFCSISTSVNESESFTTPFGAGATFPNLSVDIPVLSWPVPGGFAAFNAGLKVEPTLGSTNISADWAAVAGSDCSGSGSVSFSEPGVPVVIGPIKACDLGPTSEAEIELNNFRYHFNNFLIDLSATLDFELFAIEPFFGGDTFGITIPIATFDLGPITGGLFVPDHVQCTFDFNCSRTGPDNSLIFTAQTIDTTAPETVLFPSMGTPGDNGWWVTDVEVTLVATDNGLDDCGTGVVLTEYSFNGVDWIPYGGPFMLTDEGITTVFYRSTDAEDNLEIAKSEIFMIDKTPPEITGAPTTPPNFFGWWNTDVTVHFEAFDAVSGIAFVTPDQVVMTEGLNQMVVGTAVDVAGNMAMFVVDNINIDKTAPLVTILSPPNGSTFANTETFNIEWMASDNLSGIASEMGTLDGVPVVNFAPVNLLLLAAGPHNVFVEVLDKADNVGTDSVSFFVTVDIDGLIAALDEICNLGWITNQGVCNGLRAKLNAAKAAIERGQSHVAENQLNAFINQLDAQRGKAVSEMAYNVLKTNALFVIDNLPEEPEAAVEIAPVAPENPGNNNPGNPNPGNNNPGNNDPGNNNPGNNNPGNPNPGNNNPGNNNPGNNNPGNNDPGNNNPGEGDPENCQPGNGNPGNGNPGNNNPGNNNPGNNNPANCNPGEGG